MTDQSALALAPTVHQLRQLDQEAERVWAGVLPQLEHMDEHGYTALQYESTAAALALVRITISFESSVADLADVSLQTLAPAAGCARGALEAAIKAAWLTQPAHAMDREGRWLGWYQATERFYDNLAKDVAAHAPNVATSLRATAMHYREDREAILRRLPEGHAMQMPGTVVNMLQDLGEPNLYAYYRALSQYQHAEPEATRAFLDLTTRDTPSDPPEGMARKPIIYNLVHPAMWQPVIKAAAFSLALVCTRALVPFGVGDAAESRFGAAYQRVLRAAEHLPNRFASSGLGDDRWRDHVDTGRGT